MEKHTNIPHIFHQVWLGWKPLPKDFQRYQQTWIDLHPDWELKMWNESNIWELQDIDFDDLELCKNYSEKSDYLRFLIIKNHGGVYIDTDFECLRPLDKLIQDYTFFIAPDGPYIASGIFGAIKNHSVVNKIFLSLHDQLLYGNKLDSVYKIWPWYINIFRDSILASGGTIFPKECFYPEAWGEWYYYGLQLDNEKLIEQGAFAIHHYTYSWNKKAYWKRRFLYRSRFIRKIDTIYQSCRKFFINI